MNISERIKKIRIQNNLSQKELADKLFVSNKTISSYESGRTDPSLDILYKISEVLNCSLIYLLYGNKISDNIETEIKIRLSEKEFKYLDSIMKVDAKYINKIEQKDVYYQPISRPFINKNKIIEWLRIGERGGRNIINYKYWYSTHCDEYEVEFDNVDSLKKIFSAIGLEKVATVDKVRKLYLYKDKYEIALDFVKDLGYFIEIEVKKYDKDIETEYKDLLMLAKVFNLSLDNIDKRGYPYYFLES